MDAARFEEQYALTRRGIPDLSLGTLYRNNNDFNRAFIAIKVTHDNAGEVSRFLALPVKKEPDGISIHCLLELLKSGFLKIDRTGEE